MTAIAQRRPKRPLTQWKAARSCKAADSDQAIIVWKIDLVHARLCVRSQIVPDCVDDDVWPRMNSTALRILSFSLVFLQQRQQRSQKRSKAADLHSSLDVMHHWEFADSTPL